MAFDNLKRLVGASKMRPELSWPGWCVWRCVRSCIRQFFTSFHCAHRRCGRPKSNNNNITMPNKKKMRLLLANISYTNLRNEFPMFQLSVMIFKSTSRCCAWPRNRNRPGQAKAHRYKPQQLPHLNLFALRRCQVHQICVHKSQASANLTTGHRHITLPKEKRHTKTRQRRKIGKISFRFKYGDVVCVKKPIERENSHFWWD